MSRTALRYPLKPVKLLLVGIDGGGGGKRMPSPPPAAMCHDYSYPILTCVPSTVNSNGCAPTPSGNENHTERQTSKCPVAQLARACDCYLRTSQGREFKPLRGSIFDLGGWHGST